MELPASASAPKAQRSTARASYASHAPKGGRQSSATKRKGKSPWKRGPVAYGVAQRAAAVLEELHGDEGTYFSLREAARILGISTQPLRAWYRDGWVAKGPLDRKFPAAELRRFVCWLVRYAKPYAMEERLRRIHKRVPFLPRSFEKIRQARYEWPKGCKWVSPTELAALVGCHPSLITKAIAQGRLRAWKRNKVNWAINKYDRWILF